MKRGLLLFIIGAISCTSIKPGLDQTRESLVKLNFENCVIDKSYKFIELMVPNGYKLSKQIDHGMCEYRFTYKDGAILYLSSNTFSGSELNYANRLEKGISTYSISRSENDSVRNSGKEGDDEFWLEWVNGNFTIGYVNSKDSLEFIETLNSVKLIK